MVVSWVFEDAFHPSCEQTVDTLLKTVEAQALELYYMRFLSLGETPDKWARHAGLRLDAEARG